MFSLSNVSFYLNSLRQSTNRTPSGEEAESEVSFSIGGKGTAVAKKLNNALGIS
jgi:hypothetical protein